MGKTPPQPTGKEPTFRRWNAAKGAHEQVEVQPTHCHKGHRYVVGRDSYVSISWVGCGCSDARNGGHNIYFCWTVVDGRVCRDERWQPACTDPDRRARGHYQG
jgi:hypothetical protein